MPFALLLILEDDDADDKLRLDPFVAAEAVLDSDPFLGLDAPLLLLDKSPPSCSNNFFLRAAEVIGVNG